MKLFGLLLIPLALLVGLIDARIRSSDPEAEVTAIRFDGLGSHSRPASRVPMAQRFFDQGLAFLYAYNHDEAIRSFEQAAALDPDCPLAYWGISLAHGSHINKTVVPQEREKMALDALQKALRVAHLASDADKAMIQALTKRYADPAPADRAPLDKAYAAAMKAAWEQFPKDADVGALYAESLMNLRPWDLWTNDGQPQPGTNDITRVLSDVLQLFPNHPLALHLTIHAWEASPTPRKADDAADRLRHLQPGLGHMVHMPSHIDVRRGRWVQAIEANERAIKADEAYRTKAKKQDFYYFYMAHNHHMLGFAAMMKGESKRAAAAMQTMLASIPAEWLAVKENAAMADGYLAAPLEVMMRFGRWDEILKQPEFPEQFPIARTLRCHIRAVAFAAKGNAHAARAEQARFRERAKQTPAEATFGNNKASLLFEVADKMLEGEILAAEGKLDEAIVSLREAVKVEDTLRYCEPPDWIVPVRHALGAFLLTAGRLDEAEAVYRADLKQWPDNGWSLHGLADCLKRQGRTGEAASVRKAFEQAWKGADVEIPASCLCAKP